MKIFLSARQRFSISLVPLWVALLMLSMAYNRPALAQVFAPGNLAKAHSQWNSLTSCDKCHSSDKKVDRKKCLACHQAVAERIAKKSGFHGQKRVRTAPCEACHPEHRGESANLINWARANASSAMSAPGSLAVTQENFDHEQTGWPLRGAHAKLKCAKCHQSRLIQDKRVLEYARTHKGSRTFQGLPTACNACHFDEHRGQTQPHCEKCHNETAFKPAAKFQHDTVWKLEGAHRKVPCIKCHPTQKDTEYNRDAFPKPRAESFLHMSPLPHEKCIDCHKDPHQNRFGENCLDCHNKDSWLINSAQKDLSFHDDTDFPLLGRHRSVPCEHCHPRAKDGKMKLNPVAHARCNTCHPNAHPDLSDSNRLERDCSDCHNNNGFSPSLYTVAQHAKTKFPLSVSHQTTPCTDCHLKQMGPPVETTVARKVNGYTAAKVLSPWRMKSKKTPADCGNCHKSPHRDQFAKQPCTDCHQDSSWQLNPRQWQHDKHSKYALKGKHQKLPCAACHKTETDLDGEFTRYRPIDHQDCAPCHADQHLGQFRLLTPKKQCRECHEEKGFAPSKFNHNDPAFSSFALKGKHAEVRCIKCHPRVKLDDKVSTLRYRPTVADCDLCHADQHKGAFRKASKLQRRSVAQRPTMTTESSDQWGAPKNWFPAESNRTDCQSCHRESSWHDVTFDHSATKFPLKGRHREVPCEACHKENIQAHLPLDCVGCHEDVHKGTLGANCTECHNENGFHQTAPILFARHNRTGFPLVGRHAALPCTECHRDANSREFKKVPKDCIACHAEDVPGPGDSFIDHSVLQANCDQCHTPVSWKTAAFEGHDRCFPIGTFSKHGSVSCKKCHQGNPPSAITDCTSGSFSCIQCHGCESAKHRNVRDYSCEDRRCWQCHRNP